MKINIFLKIISAIIICQLAGVIGSYFTVSSIQTWYLQLEKPALNPPNSVFGPVWITLYTLMGISLFLVWQKEYSKIKKKALVLFYIQLFLNALWSIIFFGLQSPFWALVNIIILWLFILWTILVFYKVSKPAAYLLLPYILWVSFATYLNYSILILN